VAEPIETNDGRAYNPKVASDGNGNAIAVWSQYDGTNDNIWANHYMSDTGWGKAVLIGRDNLGNAYYPQVAMDSSGNAIAVWHQRDGGADSIWANRYLSGQGWGIAETIETGTLTAIDPQIAMNSSGYAIVVWSYQHDGTTNNIWANRYQPDRGWDGARLIGKNAGYASYPQVDVDGHGDAIVVWSQTDGPNDNIWANRYRFAKGWDKGWGDATLIETDHGDAYYPQVAMDGSGNAIAVWSQTDGPNDNILANRYISATGWGGATLIETNNLGNASGPQVAMDDGGNAIVVWSQTNGIKKSIWANRYRSGMGAGWDKAGLLEVKDLGDASYPQVGMDSYGNAIAVWSQYDGANDNIWANRYLFGMDWGTPELFNINNSEDAYDPDVAVNRDGSAIAVWRQYDPDTDNIYANSFR
jgi:NADH:ubiquinone oxidoreductase subunit